MSHSLTFTVLINDRGYYVVFNDAPDERTVECAKADLGLFGLNFSISAVVGIYCSAPGMSNRWL